jgi:hypothetical protein
VNIELDVYDADLGNVTSGDVVDPTIGLKVKVYDRTGSGVEQLATVHVGLDDSGVIVLTVYRDLDIPIRIQTVDYFDGSRNGLTGADPQYYTVLQDR